jgi:hypothetical protein
VALSLRTEITGLTSTGAARRMRAASNAASDPAFLGNDDAALALTGTAFVFSPPN